MGKTSAVDQPIYKEHKYRGFIFAVHDDYGMLLLHCTRKQKKKAHFQLPGVNIIDIEYSNIGHIDDADFELATQQNESNQSAQEILFNASRIGAARELYEETGMDIRRNLERLKPAPLRPIGNGAELLCELKHRIFFFLQLKDDDFPTVSSKQLSSPNGYEDFHLKLILSHEHSGFIFESNPHESISKIKLHSGGVGSEALSMAISNQGRKGTSDKISESL